MDRGAGSARGEGKRAVTDALLPAVLAIEEGEVGRWRDCESSRVEGQSRAVPADIAERALDRLRSIARKLSDYYRLDRIDALEFVLTSEPPLTAAVECSIRLQHQMPMCSRIVLEVDPMCTPKEVQEVYARVRREEFGALRRMEDKHLRLAVFAMKRSGP